jgi:hypothetical protein
MWLSVESNRRQGICGMFETHINWYFRQSRNHCTMLFLVMQIVGSTIVCARFKTGCSSLVPLAISMQLEILAYNVTCDCQSLRELFFEIPSRIKRLELPPSAFESLSVPDSVEIWI